MPAGTPDPRSAPDLAQTFERRISQRTLGRVRQLRVVPDNDRMVVHGYTTSYYVKQLVIQAVLEVRDSRPGLTVLINIQVEP